MRALFPTVLAVLAGVTACGGPSRAIYEQYPYLRPGKTTIDSLLASAPPEGDVKPLSGLAEMAHVLLERSPVVRQARERYRAAIDRVPQASRLPDPRLEYAYLPLPVQTRTGPNEHRIGLSQMIPFPTKLVAKDAMATAAARKAAAAYDAAVRDALTRLKVLYADLYYYQQALTVLEKNEDLAKAISELGAKRTAEGAGMLYDVARAQSQLAQLTYDRITLSERRDVVRAQLNALLGRPVSAPVSADSSLPLLELEVGERELLESALANQQELEMLDEGIRAAEANLTLAGSSWAPDLSVGTQLMLQGPSPMTPTPPDSGDEAVMVTFGLTIPLWFHANAAAVSEAESELSASILAKKAHLDDLPARLRDALFQARNADRLRVLYDKELLPHAIAALTNAEQQGLADSGRYADVLEARAVYYSFSLARERSVADHFQAVARIEQLVGATLAPAGEVAP